MRIDEPDLSQHGTEEVTIEWHQHGFRSVDPGGLLQVDPPPCARAAVAHAWLAVHNEWQRGGAQASVWDVEFVRQVMHTVDEWMRNADPSPGVSQIRSYARRRVRERLARNAEHRSGPSGQRVPATNREGTGTAAPL